VTEQDKKARGALTSALKPEQIKHNKYIVIGPTSDY